jgi:hypothetical protein
MVDMDISSEHFTQPGLHRNASGKKFLERYLEIVKKNVTRKKVKPIILKWEENYAEGSNGESEVKE